MTKTVMYGGEPYTVVDYGSRCVFCSEDTSFGSGNFVNRIGADTYDEDTKEYRDGYACAGCMSTECDRCDGSIPMDEDCTPYDVYGDDDPGEFSDGSFRVCHDCLTEEEKQIWETTNG